MYKILEAKELTANIFSMVVEAERVAKSCEPGQFVIVRTDADAERIPLTICDYDREKGTVTIVFQIVGAGTQYIYNCFPEYRCINNKDGRIERRRLF